MLTVNDLIDIEHIPETNEVSLQLLIEFFESYLNNNVFVFYLANGKTIKIVFKDATEVFHLTGITHIMINNPYKKSKLFIEKAKNGSITFDSLEKMNPNAYRNYNKRIMSTFCIDTILKCSEYLYFSEGQLPNSQVKVQYLLFKGIGDNYLHLGIDTHNNGKTYYAKTLLVTENTSKEKFINRADDRIRVDTITILDKQTDEIKQIIMRRAATDKANKDVLKLAKEWKETYLKEIIAEWIKNNSESSNILPKSSVRKEWKSGLKEYFDDNKDKIREEVSQLDPYWYKKLTDEAIRKYMKNDSNDLINNTYLELDS